VFSCIVASFFRCRNPLSPTFLFLSEGQQPLFSWSVTHHPVSGISASQGTSSAYWPRRLITVIWSHTCQLVISFITTVTFHYSFFLPLQAQNSSFPQILSLIMSKTLTLPINFLFFLYQSTVLSSHAVDGHQMYSRGSVVGKTSTVGREISPTFPLIFTRGQQVRNLVSFSTAP